jgi:uncharacterized HAD superfamily protein
MKIDNRKRVAFDMDGTLTDRAHFFDIWDMTPKQLLKVYENVQPDLEMIKIVNKLYDKGYIIYIFTSRSNIYQRQTKKWLDKYKVKYHYFIMDKPYYDAFCDDKSFTPKTMKNLFKKGKLKI